MDRVIKTLKMARRAHIWSKIFLIVGTPNETKEDFEDTERMLRKAHPDRVRSSLFNPLIASPSFELYHERIDMDRIFTDYVDSDGTPYRHEHFSTQELNDIRHGICRDYEIWYARPLQRFKRKLWRARFYLENPRELMGWFRRRLGGGEAG